MTPILLAIITAILTALPPTLLALAALVASIKNGNRIQDVHLSLNSRLSELIHASKAQGMIDERTKNENDAKGMNK